METHTNSLYCVIWTVVVVNALAFQLGFWWLFPTRGWSFMTFRHVNAVTQYILRVRKYVMLWTYSIYQRSYEFKGQGVGVT